MNASDVAVEASVQLAKLRAELAGAQQAEAAMRREREVAHGQLKVAVVALRAAEQARELSVSVAAVLRDQLERWAKGTQTPADTEQALAATAELGAALAQSIRDRWEADVVAAVSGKGLAYISKALSDALSDVAAAAANALAEDQVACLKTTLVDVGCTQPLEGGGWSNSRALKAEGELLVLQRAVRKVAEAARVAHLGDVQRWGPFDEHERKALGEALAK